MVVFELVSLIVGATAGSGSTTALNPLDSVEIASLIAGLLVFLFFAVTISRNSYRRRKEMAAKVAEWEKSEEERKKRFREEMSEEQGSRAIAKGGRTSLDKRQPR